MASYKSDSEKSDRPNHYNATEFPKGKFGVYVTFTRDELERIQAHCNGMRINMSKWMSKLICDELMLTDLFDTSKDVEK